MENKLFPSYDVINFHSAFALVLSNLGKIIITGNSWALMKYSGLFGGLNENFRRFVGLNEEKYGIMGLNGISRN